MNYVEELLECADILMATIDGDDDVTPDEYNTALWQLPALSVNLLFEFMQLRDMVVTYEQTEQATEQERQAVSKIITPKLIVPGV